MIPFRLFLLGERSYFYGHVGEKPYRVTDGEAGHLGYSDDAPAVISIRFSVSLFLWSVAMAAN